MAGGGVLGTGWRGVGCENGPLRYPHEPMFGNLLGWIISLVILALTTVVMAGFYMAGAYISEPGAVGRNAASYSMQLPLDPRSLATWMSEEQDAIAIYKEAIGEYNARPQAYNIYIEPREIEFAGIRAD